jgi:hypothetical protein
MGFYNAWDLDHAVEITGGALAILQEHGFCDQTEALISHMLIEYRAGYDDEHAVLSTFERIHEDAARTMLFRRYVFKLYAEYLRGQGGALLGYQGRLQTATEPVPMPCKPYEPLFMEKSDFGQAERQIVAEIQGIQFQPPASGGFLGGLFRT